MPPRMRVAEADFERRVFGKDDVMSSREEIRVIDAEAP